MIQEYLPNSITNYDSAYPSLIGNSPTDQQVLKNDTGLITKTRDAQWRPCKLNGAPLKDVVNWVEHYRPYFEESLDRLEVYLKTVTNKKNPKETS